MQTSFYVKQQKHTEESIKEKKQCNFNYRKGANRDINK